MHTHVCPADNTAGRGLNQVFIRDRPRHLWKGLFSQRVERVAHNALRARSREQENYNWPRRRGGAENLTNSVSLCLRGKTNLDRPRIYLR